MQITATSTDPRETATQATARACDGYRDRLARRRGVSRTAVDQQCTDPSRCPLAKVVFDTLALREMGAPDPDLMVRVLCEVTGHFPPVKRGVTPAEQLVAGIAPDVVEAHARLSAEVEALAPLVAIATPLVKEARHGPRPSPPRQKHQRPREQVAGGER